MNASFLNHGCDVIVPGECEEAICEQVGYMSGQKDLPNIKGTSYLEGDQTTATLALSAS